jgi:hypothetical protein
MPTMAVAVWLCYYGISHLGLSSHIPHIDTDSHMFLTLNYYYKLALPPLKVTQTLSYGDAGAIRQPFVP